MENTNGKADKKCHKCRYCRRRFEVADDLTSHLEIHTGEKPYECIDCGARFTKGDGLRHHIGAKHNPSEVFTCNDCGRTFLVKERLKLHLRIHTGIRAYSCSHCPRSFVRRDQLQQHNRIHSGVKPYRCRFCCKRFIYHKNLTMHLKRHNGILDQICEICGKLFFRYESLKQHIAFIHDEISAFHCDTCGKDIKGHVSEHMRTHMSEKPFQCKTCGASFTQQSYLKVHERVHTGDRPYKCKVCDHSFKKSDSLTIHSRRHTGEKPFKCVLCSSASFAQLPHLKKHMFCIHNTNKPYFCTHCRDFFKTKSELVVHQRNCNSKLSTSAEENLSASSNGISDVDGREKSSEFPMTLSKMRILLAVLLKRISTAERLEHLRFGKRLIDDVLSDSIKMSGRKPCSDESLDNAQRLKKNIEILLEWTVPRNFMDDFRKEGRSLESVLEGLTS